MGSKFARRKVVHRKLVHADPPPVVSEDRLLVSVLPMATSTLVDDVRRGLIAVPKVIPPKHFYDERGSELFDAICHTPEYYPTRTEHELLEREADEVIADADPTDIVEIGSGAARKTRALLDALGRYVGTGRYVPIDISESMLISSSRDLLDEYPWLRIHGLAADYENRLRDSLPDGLRRLFLFLGSTLGNFDVPSSVAFLRRIRLAMRPNDSFLIGLDLVKSPAALWAAYNDAAGITAQFNLNVLRVINRELGADFDVDGFEHLAYYRPELEQVEMHLRSRRPQRVHIERLGASVGFAPGETMRTEISRKFTRTSADRMFAASGLRCRRWLTPKNGYFALALLEPVE